FRPIGLRGPARRAGAYARRSLRGGPVPGAKVNEIAANPDEAYPEPPEVQERNIWLGVRIMAGATVMFFLAFVFAYFYLRTLNNGGDWRKPGIDPPQAYGAVIVGLFVLSALAFALADRAARGARAWLPLAGLALALG